VVFRGSAVIPFSSVTYLGVVISQELTFSDYRTSAVSLLPDVSIGAFKCILTTDCVLMNMRVISWIVSICLINLQTELLLCTKGSLNQHCRSQMQMGTEVC